MYFNKIKNEEILCSDNFLLDQLYPFLVISAARQYGPIGLLAPDDPTPKIPKPSIWSLYRPMDITVYDLVYADEIYPHHPGQAHESQHEYRERLMREYEFDCERIVNTRYEPL